MLSPATCQVPAASTTPMGDLWGGIRRPILRGAIRGTRGQEPLTHVQTLRCAAVPPGCNDGGNPKGTLVVWGAAFRLSVGGHLNMHGCTRSPVLLRLQCKVSLRGCSRPSEPI